AGDGSLSVRVGPNAVWVTVDGADKAALTQDMLVRVDLNGKTNLSAHPKPLGEDLPIHLRIYRENEAVQCVLHAYPPCAAVLGQQG
ncbi:class II aldolase/adducin family protein, partial [Klebsiella oxytoca]